MPVSKDALDHFARRALPHLELMYGDRAQHTLEQLAEELASFPGSQGTIPDAPWNEQDIVLITYGNSIIAPGERPLETLYDFLELYVGKALSAVHILPFFPYSSDDGFSIVNYREVDPGLGYWGDILRFSGRYGLMADLVLNHMSRESLWFVDYTQGVEPAASFVREVDPDADVSAVVRPRQHDLRVPVETSRGTRHVWATFSDDQIDLDYENPAVLVEMARILLLYLRMGARFVRLDAVAFLWKELGTPCIHLPQTHAAVKVMRGVMETAVPNSTLVTETNVPNKENLSYFGEGDEAQMVYQFSLAPLLLHALHGGNAHHLTRWAASLSPPPAGATYLNFTASHDGIGLRPLEGLVPVEEVNRLVSGIQGFGGYVSLKANPDGSRSPYELNITYFDALKGTARGRDGAQVERFLCSQTVMLSMKGIPAIYIHSLTATQNDHLAVDLTGRQRSINRHRWDRTRLYSLLDDSGTPNSRVFEELRRLMLIRRAQPAFHPDGDQTVLQLGDALFAVVRRSVDGAQTLAAVANVTGQDQTFEVADALAEGQGTVTDLIHQAPLKEGATTVTLKPFECAWLSRQPVLAPDD